jgi:L-seryl-tRNA(Ser) seleniumtransferase
MPKEVQDAMHDAASTHVAIPELQKAFSDHVAPMLGCEAALVTAGCAAALSVATAACVAGKDPEKIRRIPDTSGLKNEVIFQKSHRFGYDHAIRNVGIKIIEVETAEELQGAVNERTAMLFFLNLADPKGKIKRAEFAHIANRLQIPCLIDAAADLPPMENLRDLTRMGFDLAAFSGGKGLRGPQCSGLLMGKKTLIEAAFLNGPPYSDTLGRGAKVGKEEIAGLYRALQLYLKTDHAAEWSEWERRVAVIDREISRIPGVHTKKFVPEIANHAPHLSVEWDAQKIPLTSKQIVENLRSKDPRIELRPGSEESKTGIEVAVWMLRPGEEKIVARRLREALSGK